MVMRSTCPEKFIRDNCYCT